MNDWSKQKEATEFTEYISTIYTADRVDMTHQKYYFGRHNFELHVNCVDYRAVQHINAGFFEGQWISLAPKHSLNN